MMWLINGTQAQKVRCGNKVKTNAYCFTLVLAVGLQVNSA